MSDALKLRNRRLLVHRIEEILASKDLKTIDGNLPLENRQALIADIFADPWGAFAEDDAASLAQEHLERIVLSRTAQDRRAGIALTQQITRIEKDAADRATSAATRRDHLLSQIRAIEERPANTLRQTDMVEILRLRRSLQDEQRTIDQPMSPAERMDLANYQQAADALAQRTES
ncbi:hypothetical protein FHS85_001872 [Rhodoligotrophos appendicifer]|uniref:hypothetical protein n=1 Tax=Rhodoligotrophos appendicifer TaxID=987056 RepID=UPI0011857D4B|nr:hypothetical protein [Rhodoligotrophos appendicifer]